ncbi:bifunctional glutamate N-acetyltransferase/amino-acid acetyltransferase ArgJ [Kordiimonas sp. SCSIO 12610]|uniref:bifunctional glutamate N-acetyltransferase/amino-acid acetyltransferase ArgJ n=1 Tax=Kordiimonas sp. SCSIO 12610 TaxID=2829597 RepID=UPI00210AA04B|nr:bifunctional glutamate N-acetyltransferase/amino-acid acetyltransferase ArgJ [Kordiimonas sp. SCSIO 12610]UTW55732.1 bifunctional glutamate N-acetyltransferase/amino-acid acetyltransferase ArgJ [Kordiimonas sp. SCSIO 12610]
MTPLPRSPLAPKNSPHIFPVKGAKVAALEANLRYKDRPDLLLATFADSTVCVGVFTRSKTAAAPVIWCQDALSAGADVRALVVNAGNANAFTGREGERTCRETGEHVAHLLNCKPEQTLLASTGVIGEPLDPEPIKTGLSALASKVTEQSWGIAAEAIMTTDTFPKAASKQFDLDGQPVTITGIAKGSGMIAPDMATMLGFVMADAAISQECLQAILRDTTNKSFNAITVDGDTSTNDCVLAFATGQSNANKIENIDDPRFAIFKSEFQAVMTDLAHQIVRDGEGAQKFVEVQVEGAENDIAAQNIGKTIANSPLVKTAIAGEDPNWGRIVMAIGKSGEAADRDKLRIWIGDQLIACEGKVHEDYSETDAANHMKGQEISIRVDVGIAGGVATVWTCDLTHQYIEINADYRS